VRKRKKRDRERENERDVSENRKMTEKNELEEEKRIVSLLSL
jgi:hypothetical protein